MNNESITTKEAAVIIAAVNGLASFSESQVRRLCASKLIDADKHGTVWFVNKLSAENYRPRYLIKSVGEK